MTIVTFVTYDNGTASCCTPIIIALHCTGKTAALQ